MGFRFRRRIKLFPGLWLNASKSGISASIGGHGGFISQTPQPVAAATPTPWQPPASDVPYSATTPTMPSTAEKSYVFQITFIAASSFLNQWKLARPDSGRPIEKVVVTTWL
jgi:hypothetical protein